MGQINIDKYFKERLSDYSEDIDTDAIWSDLDLAEKKKNRGIIFWLFCSMSITALVAVVYFGIFASSHEITESSLKNIPIDHHICAENEENFKTSPPSTDNLYTNEKIITKRNKWNEKSKSKIANEVTPHSTQHDISQLLASKKYSQPRKTKVNSTLIIQPLIETTQINLKSNQNINPSKETDQKVISGRHLLDKTIINMLDIKLLDYASHMDNFKDGVDNLSIVPLIRKNNRPINIDFYSSYNVAKRRLTTDFPVWLDEFIKSKNESETILDAISVGTSIRYNLRSGLYAKLGVEALSITERFNHTMESTETVIEGGFIRGSRPVTSRWVNYNHHKLLSLPLSIGYEQYRGRWSYFVEGSFHLNLLYQFTGLQLDSERNVTEEVVIDRTVISDARPRHSYVLSVGVRYQLAPRLSLYLQPRFQSTFSMDRRTMPDRFSTPISQNYNLYGIQFGLSYSLD